MRKEEHVAKLIEELIDQKLLEHLRATNRIDTSVDHSAPDERRRIDPDRLERLRIELATAIEDLFRLQ
jgi:hypothetical protein